MDKLDVSTWRVLLVDDEPDSNEIVKMVLSARGATVFEAADGQEGLEIFRHRRPNLVLTDISMPEVDGWELLQRIRVSGDGLERTPVIALTAHAMIGDRERVLEAGFDGYMSKPLSMLTLVDDLVECLNQQTR
jgi:CheY-like chemotaxis protein